MKSGRILNVLQEQSNICLSVADWRDAELMRDIEAATGEDLGSDRLGGKKRKGKKKKYPHLSDLKQSTNTSRCRLEKKVFNKYECLLQLLDDSLSVGAKNMCLVKLETTN